MIHLTRYEIFLYIKKVGLKKTEKEKIQRHLQTCSLCQQELKDFKSNLKQIKQNNLAQCDNFLQKLPAYLENNLSIKEKSEVKNHLSECEHCRALFSLVSEKPDWRIQSTNIEIPFAAQKRIEKKVLSALDRKMADNAIKKIEDKMIENIDKLIQKVILAFRPLQQGFAFRGDEEKELKIIEHAGGNLLIETGIENALLELTSIFEEFTVKAKTDKEGIVIFKNLPKGDYIAHINGYFLEDIKIKEQ